MLCSKNYWLKGQSYLKNTSEKHLDWCLTRQHYTLAKMTHKINSHNSRTKTCTQNFITVLCVIPPKWKAHNCPSTSEYLNRWWYTDIMKYSQQRSKLLIHATTWVEFKGIMLSEKNPVSKGHILYNSTYIAY